MSTLLDALSDGSYDMQNKRDLSGDFSKKLLSYRDNVVSDYLKYKVNLSEAISKIARRDNLNDDQIQRIIEEVNNQIYLIEYDKLKSSTTRDVEFDIASMQGVKKHLNGEDTDSDKEQNSDENGKKNILKKSAFEQIKMDEWEKTASVHEENFYSDAPDYKYCDMSISDKVSRDEFMLRKIASTVNEKHSELERLTNSANYKAYELSDVFVNLERLGANTSEIVSSMIKTANISDKEFCILKEATDEKLQSLIELRYLPSNFSVNLDGVSVEKTASERFSLGSLSRSKTASINCEYEVPRMELSTGKMIRNFGDIVKLASEFKDTANQLIEKNREYVAIREKCAGYGITNEMIEDIDFFQLSQVKK